MCGNLMRGTMDSRDLCPPVFPFGTDPQTTCEPLVTLEDIHRAEAELGVRFPPTYITWLHKAGGVFHCKRRNELQLFPLFGEQHYSVIGLTKWIRAHEPHQLDDLVVFAGCRVDGELWGFLTRETQPESPVIWMSPGSIPGKGYDYTAKNFLTFLDQQSQYLFATEDSNTDTAYINHYPRMETIIEVRNQIHEQ